MSSPSRLGVGGVVERILEIVVGSDQAIIRGSSARLCESSQRQGEAWAMVGAKARVRHQARGRLSCGRHRRRWGRGQGVRHECSHHVEDVGEKDESVVTRERDRKGIVGRDKE